MCLRAGGIEIAGVFRLRANEKCLRHDNYKSVKVKHILYSFFRNKQTKNDTANFWFHGFLMFSGMIHTNAVCNVSFGFGLGRTIVNNKNIQ